jgi:hypothetical protein
MKKILFFALLLTNCTKAYETDVPKAKWMDQMITVLPTILCRPEGFFRSCYPLTEDQCLEISVRTTKACLIKLEGTLPTALSQPRDGEKWGKEIGACSGETMESALPAEGKNKVAKDSCNDPNAWKM